LVAPFLVDVREPREFKAGHLAGAVAELGSRLGEIPAGELPAFICRSGARSLTGCSIALRGGVAQAVNLEVGMLAWAAEIDPTMVVAARGGAAHVHDGSRFAAALDRP
jgi:Rhodanese-related sulfurtransferase